MRCARVADLLWPGAMGRKLQGRKPLELRTPIVQHSFQRSWRAGACMPNGIVCVLDWQLRQRRRLA